MSVAGFAILALVAAFFLTLTWLSWKSYCLFHREGRTFFVAVAIVSSLFWLVLPFIVTSRLSGVFRIVRALLIPPWFFWICFTLVHVSVLALVLLFWYFLARKTTPLRTFGRIYSEVFFLVMAIVTLVGTIQALVPLRVETVPIRIDGLPRGLEGMKLALVSDIHAGLLTRPSRLARISREINAARPDHVVIVGDMIDDDPYFLPKFLAGLVPVDRSIPITAVLGNHEIYGDPHAVIRRLKGSRVRLLVNEGQGVLRGDSILWLAGISDFAGAARRSGSATESQAFAPDPDAALRGRPEGAFTVLLAHQPRAFQPAIERRIPLVLAGHTHGGQLGIRWLNWSLAGVFLPEDMGLYEKNGTQMYVTTGAGHWVVPIRFGMSPEVVIVELRGR